jgi:hypothetical protein
MGRFGMWMAGLAVMGGSFVATYALGRKMPSVPTGVTATAPVNAGVPVAKMSCCEPAGAAAAKPAEAPGSVSAPVEAEAECVLCKSASVGRAVAGTKVSVPVSGGTTQPSAAVNGTASGKAAVSGVPEK